MQKVINVGGLKKAEKEISKVTKKSYDGLVTFFSCVQDIYVDASNL